MKNWMNKALVFFYSQNGSTKKIAEEIAKGLKNKDYKVDLVDILKDHNKDVSEYDIIGVGFPVYFYRPPYNLTDLIKKIPSLSETKKGKTKRLST